MASILLSFVGQQDPVSDQTREDGSIVTLIGHLLAAQTTIRAIILLCTENTQERAELTQAWLMDAPYHLSADAVQIMPVGVELSQDPVNLWLAVQAARRGLEVAIEHSTPQDMLEFNASSGTPVMKSTWSILQAAGYAPRSRVWQVRNPKEQRADQARVFQTNVQILRQEFDLKVIKQQLQDYNYNGALTTLKASGFSTPTLEALLEYGHYRLSLAFRKAKEAIDPISSAIDCRWLQEIMALCRREPEALLQEAYFNAIVEQKNQKLSDFLVRVSQFQEKALQYFVNQQLGLPLPSSFEDTERFWSALYQQYPDLYQFLKAYPYRNHKLKLEAHPNRSVLLAILEYNQHPLWETLQVLNTYCEKRNQYVHQFEGISELNDSDTIRQTMRQVLNYLGKTDSTNSFNRLNQQVVQLLDLALQLPKQRQ